MAGNRRTSKIDGLAGEVIAAAEQSRRLRPSAFAAERAEITHSEYVRSLRNCFSGSEVRELLRELRKAEPCVSQDRIRFGSMKNLCDRASSLSASLGADFRLSELSWPSGLALWGFYLNRGPGLQKPLIWVNGAHHHHAATMAFGHEVGHHVTARLFGMQGHLPLPSLYTGFESHLDDQLELAADITVSLGMYPHNAAMKFSGEIGHETTETGEQCLGSAVGAVVDDLWRRSSLNRASLSLAQRVQYQAALIHFTKLRQALLHEYSI